jgi:hypothetical protein
VVNPVFVGFNFLQQGLCFLGVVPKGWVCRFQFFFSNFFFPVSEVKETSSAPLNGSLHLLVVLVS